MNSPVISARDLTHRENGFILDVRTDMEHSEKRLCRRHEHVPLDRLDPAQFAASRGLGRDAEIYLLCRGGNRARQAAAKFAAAGYPHVSVIEGGIVACEEAGLPVEGRASHKSVCTGNYPLPLERQVRIAAGVFIALGAVAALTFHPFFAFVPLALGCGLVFAGITDRCGLALLLTKAPWNKICKQI